MKEELCKAFCDELMVQTVPAGMAVTTPFAGPDGDHIGFYVVKEGDGYRIEDDGVTLPYLEGSGVEFRPGGTRGDALNELLAEYGVSINDVTQEFFIGNLSETVLPSAALKFVAFSLRVRDFMLMTEFRIATTFREDAAKMSFAEIFAEQFGAQAQDASEEARPDEHPVLVELARQRLAYQQQLQAQSKLQFFLGQKLRALASQLNRLARWISP